MLNFPIDHIGIAVTDLDQAIESYRKNFGYELDLIEEVASQKVKIAFLKTPNTLIELLASTSDESTLAKFLAKRGPGLHHICFRVPDIKLELTRLTSLGFDLIDKQPRPGAHNSKIAFIHPKSTAGTLIEICERI